MFGTCGSIVSEVDISIALPLGDLDIAPIVADKFIQNCPLPAGIISVPQCLKGITYVLTVRMVSLGLPFLTELLEAVVAS